MTGVKHSADRQQFGLQLSARDNYALTAAPKRLWARKWNHDKQERVHFEQAKERKSLLIGVLDTVIFPLSEAPRRSHCSHPRCSKRSTDLKKKVEAVVKSATTDREENKDNSSRHFTKVLFRYPRPSDGRG